MSSQDPELWARRSTSFGAAAREYAEHRPDYAPAAIAWALAGAERPVREVLDLAAGTGALSGGLVTAGVDVVAVEPDAGMRAELERRLPAVRSLAGGAEAIPLPDDSVDAVTVATAWHWFDEERALAEVARVLRPGGVLALLYDLDDDSVPWVVELDRVKRTSASSPPSDTDEPMPTWPGWTPPEEERFTHVQSRTAASLTATIGTQSHTLVVSPQERAETLARIQAFLEANPATADGSFDLPMHTYVTRTRRLGTRQP